MVMKSMTNTFQKRQLCLFLFNLYDSIVKLDHFFDVISMMIKLMTNLFPLSVFLFNLYSFILKLDRFYDVVLTVIKSMTNSKIISHSLL